MAEEIVEQEHVTVVTSENFHAFVDKQLGIDPEAAAKEELAKVEEEKAAKTAADGDPAEEFVSDPEPAQKLTKKEKLNARFKELTDARKEAERKGEEAASLLKQEREAREALERERNELKTKYEPPKSDELGVKPELAQFQTAADYEKALEEWTGDKVRIEEGKKRVEEQAQKRAADAKKAWDANMTVVKAKIADYSEVITASEVLLSNEAKEAIFESEFGPEMLYHYAKNPEEATKLGELTVDKMHRAIGRLEAKLGEKPQTEKIKVAEISKAPPPITPLKGGSAVVGVLKGSDDVPDGWTYDQWKKHYDAGKIH